MLYNGKTDWEVIIKNEQNDKQIQAVISEIWIKLKGPRCSNACAMFDGKQAKWTSKLKNQMRHTKYLH